MNGPTPEEIASWYPRLYRTAVRLTGSQDDAADVTQQAFLQALGGWRHFDGRAVATTWLHRILVNCVRDWQRRRARDTAPVDVWAVVPAGHEGGLADDADRRERLDRLRNAIRDLPDTLRPAFVITVLDGYTYKEASDLLDIPVGTVASRVFEARRIVREVMHETFPEGES